MLTDAPYAATGVATAEDIERRRWERQIAMLETIVAIFTAALNSSKTGFVPVAPVAMRRKDVGHRPEGR